MRKDIDWDKADWTKHNATLASKFSCSPNTVRRMRIKLGIPPANIMPKQRKEKLTEARKKALEKGRYAKHYKNKALTMKGIKHDRGNTISSTHLTYGQSHPSATHHSLTSPEGDTYTFNNIEHFIRTHTSLFLIQDTIIRRKPNGKRYTRAANGLQATSNRSKKSWKGWTLP